MTRLSDAAAVKDLSDAIEDVRFHVLGLPEIPEYEFIRDYFFDGADTQMRLFVSALKHRRKEGWKP